MEKYKQKNKELGASNSQLTQQICSMQQKQQTLEVTLNTYKKYKQILHHAAGIQCLQCQKLMTREEFSIHLPDCRQNMMRQSTIVAASVINPVKIRIVDCKLIPV